MGVGRFRYFLLSRGMILNSISKRTRCHVNQSTRKLKHKSFRPCSTDWKIFYVIFVIFLRNFHWNKNLRIALQSSGISEGQLKDSHASIFWINQKLQNWPIPRIDKKRMNFDEVCSSLELDFLKLFIFLELTSHKTTKQLLPLTEINPFLVFFVLSLFFRCPIYLQFSYSVNF